MKKLLIAVGIAAAVLAAVLAVITLTGGKEIPAEDPGCKYEYSYTVKKGLVTVTVRGASEDGCVWTVGGFLPTVAEATVKDAGKNDAVFEIRYVGRGTTEVSLLQCSGTDPEDLRYELLLTVYADADGAISVIGCTHREYSPTVRGGEAGGISYTVNGRAGGGLAVRVQNAEPTGWKEAGEIADAVTVSELTETEDGFSFEITGKSAAEGDLVLYSEEQGKKLTLRLRIGGNLSVTLLSDAIGTYDPEKEVLDPEEHEFRKLTGLTAFPQGTERSHVSVYDLGTPELVYRMAICSYGVERVTCTVKVTADLTEEEMRSVLLKGEADEAQATLGDTDAVLLTKQADGTNALLWSDANGTRFFFTGSVGTEDGEGSESMTAEDLIAAAERFVSCCGNGAD